MAAISAVTLLLFTLFVSIQTLLTRSIPVWLTSTGVPIGILSACASVFLVKDGQIEIVGHIRWSWELAVQRIKPFLPSLRIIAIIIGVTATVCGIAFMGSSLIFRPVIVAHGDIPRAHVDVTAEPNKDSSTSIPDNSATEPDLIIGTLLIDPAMRTGTAVGSLVLVLFIAVGLKKQDLGLSSYLNYGINQSLRNAIMVFGTSLFIVVINFIALFGFDFHSNLAILFLSFCLSLAAYLGLQFGGIAVILHFLMRLSISILGHGPFNYTLFLMTAKRLIFLEQVGGGMRFLHGFFQEEFAQLQPSEIAMITEA